MFFCKNNECCRKLEGNGMIAATVERYKISLKYTADFIKFNFLKKDVSIENVNHKFIADYEFYFRTERNCSHNTAPKYLKDYPHRPYQRILSDLQTRLTVYFAMSRLLNWGY